jgi:hypothetical protein
MNRDEFIRRLALEGISDDYENVDQMLLPTISEVGLKLGWTIERSEVVKALASLVEEGLARAYTLSGVKPCSNEISGMPSMDVIEEDFKTYFYITEKGKVLHLSDDTWWPFDNEGNLGPEMGDSLRKSDKR